jgi:hypothetical protein
MRTATPEGQRMTQQWYCIASGSTSVKTDNWLKLKGEKDQWTNNLTNQL